MKNHYRWMTLALLAFSIVAAASDQLATQIKNPDEKLRQEAAERLGKTGGRSAVPVLAATSRSRTELLEFGDPTTSTRSARPAIVRTASWRFVVA